MRGCMVLMHLRMLRMSVACVTARATAVLDVCVLRRVIVCVGCRCDVQCGAMRVDALGSVPPVQSR